MVLYAVFVTIIILYSLLVLGRILGLTINKEFYDAVDMIPGSKGIWYLGNALEYINITSKEFFEKVQADFKVYGDGRFYRVWAAGYMNFICQDCHIIELILGSNTLIDKGEEYQFILPWIGYGLLTSTGSRWRKHRKIITPTFHFKILEQFIDIFNKNGAIMCEKMEKELDKEPFNVYNYVNLAALDNIYESAMGISMNVQKNSETTYVRAIKDLCKVINKRVFIWYLRIPFVFRRTKFYKTQQESIKVIHSATEEIIKQRKKELANRKNLEKNDHKEDEFYQKKRMAFLDLLLESAEDSNLSDQDIREEVDTFMFEGHDTITSGLSFTIWALANHPEVQEKVYEEQIEIFGDSDMQPTMNDLQNMKYLERTLKESQRLYPSVPMIIRRLKERLELPDGYFLPKNTNVAMIFFSMHRDPKIWGPNPEKFNPDNFTPEAIQGRHPYCYVPFSAGPRNCIGQKFAMLEMKSTISKIVRQYKLLPSPYERHKLQLTSELVLLSKSGWHIKIQRR